MRWTLNRLLVGFAGLLQLAGVFVDQVLAGGDPRSLPFLVGPAAALVVLFWSPAWMFLVAAGLLAALPLFVLFGVGAAAAITHPGSGLEALALTLVAAGAALGIVGGVAGLLEARRGEARRPARDVARAPQGVLALAIAALFVGLIVSSAWAESEVRDISERPATMIAGANRTVRMVTDTHHFAPREVRIAVGELVDIHVANGDPVVHTFSYRYQGAMRESVIPAHGETDIWLRFDAPQTLKFWCQPHSEGEGDTNPDAMWGTLVVS